MKKRVMNYIKKFHPHSSDEIWEREFNKAIDKKKVERLYEKCICEIIDNIFNGISN